ncbi:MAG: hypothetical protein ABIT83_08765 [Massilia sp.]
MPIFGLGIHVLVAIFFAIHAIRAGRELYWLVILFMFPMLGSVVYFFAIFLPASRMERGLRTAGKALERTINPGRALREAQAAFDLTPTAHNQMRLARAMLDGGMVAQAVAQFDAFLAGPFANDPEIGMSAGEAKLANQQPQEALKVLAAVRANSPGFRPEQVGLLTARAHAQAGNAAEAGAEFAALAARFSSVEARAEYAIWAIGRGDRATAERELAEVDHARKHMTKHTRSLHQALFQRLDAARSALGRS